jgi:hypothetical protein
MGLNEDVITWIEISREEQVIDGSESLTLLLDQKVYLIQDELKSEEDSTTPREPNEYRVEYNYKAYCEITEQKYINGIPQDEYRTYGIFGAEITKFMNNDSDLIVTLEKTEG